MPGFFFLQKPLIAIKMNKQIHLNRFLQSGKAILGVLFSLALLLPAWSQETSPQGSSRGNRSLAEAAAASFNAGQYNEAIVGWTSMINKGDQVKTALLNRAKAYLVIQQPLLAIEDLNSLEKTAAPNEKSTLLVLKAVAFSSLGQKDESLRAFNQAEALDRNPYVYINRATVYQDMGDLDSARLDLQKAITMQPSRANYFNLAVLERRSFNYKACIEILTAILKQDNSFVPAYAQRGICLASDGKHQEAIQDLLKAITLDPTLADAYFQLGKSMLALGKTEAAKSYLLKSADLYLAQGKIVSYRAAMKLIAAPSR
ncbi:MAG: tetratricopeptide repeat protein [Cyanobacteria bacterium]|nr:tetratricopeptide repeat protein [Cyanobacteriota bacterium]